MNKNEAMNEIRNGVDEDTFVNYLKEFTFTEDEIREFWNMTDLVNWLKYQGENMSKEFKNELIPHKVTKADLIYNRLHDEEKEIEQKVLSFDWTIVSKNKWNKFKSFVKKDLMWGAYKLKKCDEYKTYVEVFIDDQHMKILDEMGHYDEEHKKQLFNEGGYAAFVNESIEAKIRAYKQLANWLGI